MKRKITMYSSQTASIQERFQHFAVSFLSLSKNICLSEKDFM